jgi:cytochrome c553
MSATLLSEDGEARLARLAWRELQRHIAKYPRLELTRASEIANYLRELAVGRNPGTTYAMRLSNLSDSRVAMAILVRIRSQKRKRSGKLSPGMMLRLGPRRKLR